MVVQLVIVLRYVRDVNEVKFNKLFQKYIVFFIQFQYGLFGKVLLVKVEVIIFLYFQFLIFLISFDFFFFNIFVFDVSRLLFIYVLLYLQVVDWKQLVFEFVCLYLEGVDFQKEGLW